MKNRIFEYCFWMQRYYQRVKESSKLLKIYHKYYLDHSTLTKEIQDHPLIIAAGLENGFQQTSLDSYDSITQLLTWDPTYENSIYSNLKKARDNARLVREIICDEAWMIINDLWLWFNDQSTHENYQNHRDNFFDVIIEHHQLTLGIFEDTLRQDEFYHFIQMGMLIEKILIHANLLGLHLKNAEKGNLSRESEMDRMLIQSLYGWDSFCRVHSQNITPHNIVESLVIDPYFPASISFCTKELNRSLIFLKFPNKHALLDVVEILEDIKKQIQLKTHPNKIITSLRTITGIIESLANQLTEEYFREKSL